jgi:hypothetical protein
MSKGWHVSPAACPHAESAGSAYESAEDGPEDEMDGRLVDEDAPVAEERRPGAAPPVGVETVDERHRRPERHVLGLGGEDAPPGAASAGARERDAEERSVRKVRGEADRPPCGPSRDERAQEANVRVPGRRPDCPRDKRF